MATSNNTATQRAWDTLQKLTACKLQSWFPEYNLDLSHPTVMDVATALAGDALMVSGRSISHWQFDNMLDGMEHPLISKLDTADCSRDLKNHYRNQLLNRYVGHRAPTLH